MSPAVEKIFAVVCALVKLLNRPVIVASVSVWFNKTEILPVAPVGTGGIIWLPVVCASKYLPKAGVGLALGLGLAVGEGLGLPLGEGLTVGLTLGLGLGLGLAPPNTPERIVAPPLRKTIVEPLTTTGTD